MAEAVADVEVIVVGAGPAGSAAAVALARAGRDVLLLDRAQFPRDKPCGDLIGVRAVGLARALGIDPDVLESHPRLAGALLSTDDGMVDLGPGSAVGRRWLAGDEARVVPRRTFDAAMVEAALRSGAQLERATVRRVAPSVDGGREVTLSRPAGEERVRARAVVLAGGYGGRVLAAPELGDRDDGPPRGIAMRGYWSGATAPSDRIVFSLDRWVLPGYGWLFPLPDGGANVGVGTLATGEAGRESLRDLYERFTGDPASPVAAWLRGARPVGEPRSWPLDLGPRRRRIVADRMVVAGESAGLVGPLTGAGIAFALDSGRLAGETVAAALSDGDLSRAALSGYGHRIRWRYAPWLRGELLAQRYLGDPGRLSGFVGAIRPLPVTGVLGAKLLLHLG